MVIASWTTLLILPVNSALSSKIPLATTGTPMLQPSEPELTTEPPMVIHAPTGTPPPPGVMKTMLLTSMKPGATLMPLLALLTSEERPLPTSPIPITQVPSGMTAPQDPDHSWTPWVLELPSSSSSSSQSVSQSSWSKP